MPLHIVTVSDVTKVSGVTPVDFRKRVLVFSPDPDLARFLLLTMEDRFQIIREHSLANFQETLQQALPHLILIDLCTFPEEISKQLEILCRAPSNIPIIVLRAYLVLPPEINKAIDQLADEVFYKPVDVVLITQAIEDRLK
jgi:DNA-binding NtrC family response regulator